MKNIKLFVGFMIMLLSGVTAQAQITQKATYGKFAITNVTIHTITNGIIEDGMVLIEGEKITYVGTNANITDAYEVIDGGDSLQVYPGFMDSGTQLGLVEVGSLDLTKDANGLGEFIPQMRAFTAINPNSVSIPVTRVNGVTHVISLPVGGRISGMATLIDLYGYSPDSMAVLPNAALHINWPSAAKGGWWDDRSEKEVREDYKEKIEALNEFWDKAVFYNKMMIAYEENPEQKVQPNKDERLDAMREVVTGQTPVIISVSKKKDILNAIEWIEKHNDKTKFILAGCQQGWRVAKQIDEAGLPCLVSTLYTPRHNYVNYQRPYQNPGLLHEAGVKVAIATGGAENVRNVLYHAGYAAAYGLGRKNALKAVTIWPAQIFGVADKLGSIEEGKQANLFISTGDPFQPWTHIVQVFIRGYKIPMVSRQSRLHEQFLHRGAVAN